MGPGAHTRGPGYPWQQPHIHTMPDLVVNKLVVEGDVKEQQVFWERVDTHE